jgi:hydroxymethylpyrimidine pyrophosphatase-like HAD family hydrolase
VATGREWDGVRRLAEALYLDGPHVLSNGAEVRDARGVLERWPLPGEQARALLDRCLARGWYAEFYLDEGFVVTDVRAPARQHWNMLEAEPSGTTQQLDLDGQTVVKATVIVFDSAQLDHTLAGLRELGLTATAGFAPATPALRYVNVTRSGVDKGLAVRRAAAAAGGGLDGLVVLGDGFNDLALFEPAGTAVAMGQAPEQVQAAAHLIAPPVSEDGVAVALHALFG